MHKFFVGILGVCIGALPRVGLAQGFWPDRPSSNMLPQTNIATIGDFYSIVCAVTQWILVFGIIIGALFVVWGGVKYITSAGESGKAEDAKDIILNAIIGVVFLLLAVGLVRIVASFFGASGFNLSLSSATCSGGGWFGAPGAGAPGAGTPTPSPSTGGGAPPPPPPPPAP